LVLDVGGGEAVTACGGTQRSKKFSILPES